MACLFSWSADEENAKSMPPHVRSPGLPQTRGQNLHLEEKKRKPDLLLPESFSSVLKLVPNTIFLGIMYRVVQYRDSQLLHFLLARTKRRTRCSEDPQEQIPLC